MKHSGLKTFIELKEISKKYPVFSLLPPKRSYTQALTNIDLDLEKGKVTCILGPNGAGKTTMLKIIADLVLPDSGTIRRPAKGQNGVGFVTPNERSFYWRLSGRENLKFFAALSRIHGREQDKRVNAVIEETGLCEFADTPYRQYSTGIKQRLNIARALLSNPPLILLDEPTSHLDPIAKAEFWEFINTRILRERNSTVLLATHDLEEAAILADQMAILHKGEIVARGTIEDLQNQMKEQKQVLLTYDSSFENENIRQLIKSSHAEHSEKETRVTIQTHDETTVHNIVLELAKEGKTPYSLIRRTPSLLSIIAHYTGEKLPPELREGVVS